MSTQGAQAQGPRKSTWPGRKQVFRRHGADGRIAGDVITVAGETQPGEGLMVSVMVDGRRTLPQPSLEEIRERAANELARLPEPLRQLSPALIAYPVEIAATVQRLAEQVYQYLSKLGTWRQPSAASPMVVTPALSAARDRYGRMAEHLLGHAATECQPHRRAHGSP
jgi:hypothetical protein